MQYVVQQHVCIMIRYTLLQMPVKTAAEYPFCYQGLRKGCMKGGGLLLLGACLWMCSWLVLPEERGEHELFA